jgi:glycosyltransferase involved in cell wall biosynthesis
MSEEALDSHAPHLGGAAQTLSPDNRLRPRQQALRSSLVRLVPGAWLSTLGYTVTFVATRWVSLRPNHRPALWPMPGADPIGAAAAEGIAAGFGARPPGRYARLAACRAADDAFRRGTPGAALEALLALVRDHPADEVLQRIVARLLDDIGDNDRAAAAWRGIVARFPQSPAAFLGLAKVLARRRDSVRAVMAGRLAQDPSDFDTLVTVGKAWGAICETGRAAAVFHEITHRFADREEAWDIAAAWHSTRGRYDSAAEILVRAWRAQRRPRHVDRLRQVEDLIARLPRWALQHRERRRRARSVSTLAALFENLVAARNEAAPPTNPDPRSILMVIGSLGAGGAERQMLNTARGLKTLRMPDTGRPCIDRLRVVVQSSRSRRHDGFFRRQLEEAEIPLIAYEELPLFGGCVADSAVRSLMPALRLLPLPMLDSVLRLSDPLCRWRPDILQIWQEPTALEVTLAALIARVPRIIVSLRSVPAIDRPDRYRAEYPIVFNALLSAAQIALSCNSRYAASRYAAWLGVEPSRFAIIPNGAERLSADGDVLSRHLYREFSARTADSGLTVGGVMRLDDNKRPSLWIKAAAGISRKWPSARFILVGDGPLRRQAMNLAARHGIADRLLFVGVSSSVGFWLSKMDLFMLLSKQEGLPNVVIEAQLSGVPVVVTPAGGAPEAVLPGVTGIITTPDPTPEEIATIVVGLGRMPDRLKAMGNAGIDWAQRAFSNRGMLCATWSLMRGCGTDGELEAGASERRSVAGMDVPA